MKTIEYKFIDKSKWPRGEWDNEPDKIQFLDIETNYPCLIVRNYGLCGYVGINSKHPYFKKDLASYEEENNLEVHGGITFNGFCFEKNKEHGVCHIVELGEDDNIWWIGFDCAHAGDFSPQLQADLFESKSILNRLDFETYKNIEYVKNEIKSLAKQLKEKENG